MTTSSEHVAPSLQLSEDELVVFAAAMHDAFQGWKGDPRGTVCGDCLDDADALAPTIELIVRARMAQAWDDGAQAATQDYGIGEAVNPYRRTCHCGRPEFVNDAIEPGWTRGLCESCDTHRCDVDPLNAPCGRLRRAVTSPERNNQ